MVLLVNAVAMPFAPTRQAAIPALANPVTLVIPTSIVTTLTNVKTIEAFAAARLDAKMSRALSNARVSMEPHLTKLPKGA